MKKILLVTLLTVIANTDVFAGTISGAECTKNGQVIRTTDDIHGFMKANKAAGWKCKYTRD
ncbi:MAG: hypothetical protein IKP65_06570 [Alphaproteobacteria bacterium]|jgi:hypothetical protein|nr:hypothetical protein [Alphaproteobacteria bacterium]